MSWIAQIKRGRYATIALSLFLALYVLKWSYELYGRKGALLSLSLYVFDPNLLAHGQLVTADLPAALMMTMALYYFWHFLKLGGKATSTFECSDARSKPIGQIFLHLLVSGLLGDRGDLSSV